MPDSSTPTAGNRLVDTEGAAAILGVRPNTLISWRCTKARRIPHIKCGRLVKYRVSDLEAWMQANTVDAGGEA